MSKSIRLIIVLASITAIVCVGAFLYLTRPLTAASQNASGVVAVLEVSEGGAAVEALFRLASDQSTVSFTIEEVLNGMPTTVVGTTNDVAGDFVINFSDPPASQIGDIAINARTLATDNDRRDAAIGRFVLQSEVDAYEFITFKATTLSGLPETLSDGDTVTFDITGDLTVAGTTQTITFKTTTRVDEEVVMGEATTIVQYADFNLSIPQVPQVANVSDEVTLTINFAAERVEA